MRLPVPQKQEQWVNGRVKIGVTHDANALFKNLQENR